MTIKAFILGIAALLPAYSAANAQAMYFESAKVGEKPLAPDTTATVATIIDEAIALTEVNTATAPLDSAAFRVRSIEEIDMYLDSIKYLPRENTMSTLPLPDYFFLPAVFDHHTFAADDDPFEPDLTGRPAYRWFEQYDALDRSMKAMKYDLFSKYPEKVSYNIDLLPEAPKQYHAVVDPSKHTIEIKELAHASNVGATISSAPVKKKHWIRSFNALLQFSQAYVSPNWYQGGNNNINMLANVVYNVKLNTEYHPNLLFETTAQYKLGINNAPNDNVHNYNITDDLFQVNTTFGIKAARRWYYSFTGQFKTQLLNSYKTNSHDLRSSFLSPGELTVGVGMTYNYANAKKTFTFDASLAPLSYGLKTCISHRISPTAYGIEEGRVTKHNFGSSGEIRLYWKICNNIAFNSRIFAFSNYDSFQADWENTLAFTINRFMSAQVNVHARYDTLTPYSVDHPDWKKLQVKEILSIGFSYAFSSI